MEDGVMIKKYGHCANSNSTHKHKMISYIHGKHCKTLLYCVFCLFSVQLGVQEFVTCMWTNTSYIEYCMYAQLINLTQLWNWS